MTVNEKIVELRKKHGLTQVELGKKLNVSQSMISQYENGTRTPNDAFLFSVGELLGRDAFHQLKPYMKNSFYINKLHHYYGVDQETLDFSNISDLIFAVESDIVDSETATFHNFDKFPDDAIERYLNSVISNLSRYNRIRLIKYLFLISGKDITSELFD